MRKSLGLLGASMTLNILLSACGGSGSSSTHPPADSGTAGDSSVQSSDTGSGGMDSTVPGMDAEPDSTIPNGDATVDAESDSGSSDSSMNSDVFPEAAPIDAPATVTLTATVSGLTPGESFVLQDNGVGSVTVSGDGMATVATGLAVGTPYALTVSTQPTTETCTINNGTGTAGEAVVIAITCVTTAEAGAGDAGDSGGATDTGSVAADSATDSSPADSSTDASSTDAATTDAASSDGGSEAGGGTDGGGGGSFTVGGVLTGLASNDSLEIGINGANQFLVSNGAFALPALPTGTAYTVTIVAQPNAPVAQTCTITNPSGTIGSSDITTVSIACKDVCTPPLQLCGTQCASAPTTVDDGSLTAGTDLFYQYSPVTAGAGFVNANWTAVAGASGYNVSVGTTAGGSDVGTAMVSATTSGAVTGLSLQGAWAGTTTYYVTVTAVCSNGLNTLTSTSNGVRIAEAATWDGTTTNLRAPDSVGGYSSNWPETGVNAIYGVHYFETVNVASGTNVLVQGWGKVDGVAPGVSPSSAAVTNPHDGWLEVRANVITVNGTITASGRGYGGGGGGGATCDTPSPQGSGGGGGLGGNGGAGNSDGCAGGGSGGGGSPEGLGNTGTCTEGGNGNLLGGGGGGAGQWGCTTAAAGGNGGTSTTGGVAGAVSDIGASGSQGCNTSSPGGAGEFSAGGGGGGSECASSCSRGGGGGGGYGGGGGGGDESHAGGGGGGGTGGQGGGVGDTGSAGAGPFAGGATLTTTNTNGMQPLGAPGGYATSNGNGDSSTDLSLLLGSGGGGGPGVESQSAGGGGGAGGGYVRLVGEISLTIGASGRVLANGAGGGAGTDDDNDCSRVGGQGGAGAGGGIVFDSPALTLQAPGTAVSARGGGGSTTNGGTIKLFYTTLSGSAPAAAGRVYNAGPGSFLP